MVGAGSDGTLVPGQTIEERSFASEGSLGAWPMIWLSRAFEHHPQEALDVLDTLGDTLVNNYEWFPKSLLEGLALDALDRSTEAQQKYQDAATALEVRLTESEGDERLHAALGLAYAGLCRRNDAVGEARRAVEVMPLTRDAHGAPWHLLKLAAVHARFGEVDEALEALTTLLSVPNQFPPGVVAKHYLLYPLRDVERFQALLERERERVF